MSTPKTRLIFEDYRRFVDGLILSFEYFYVPHQPLAAQMVFHARNHSVLATRTAHVM